MFNILMERGELIVFPFFLGIYLRVDFLVDFPAQFAEGIADTVIIERQGSIENYIVGTTGDFDPYYSLKASLRSSDTEYLMGVTYEDKKDVLDQILNADIPAIEETISLFEKVNEADNICVIGNKGAITAASDHFDQIFDLQQK